MGSLQHIGPAEPESWLSFVQMSAFVRGWDQLGLNDDDLRSLERQILESPTGAPVVAGTGGLRKARFAPPSWRRVAVPTMPPSTRRWKP